MIIYFAVDNITDELMVNSNLTEEEYFNESKKNYFRCLTVQVVSGATEAVSTNKQ